MKTRVRDLESERDETHAAVRELEASLEDELRDAALQGKETSKRAADLTAKLKQAQDRAAEPWAARISAAEAAAEALRAEYGAHTDAHIEELLDEPEISGRAEAARDALLDAAAAVDEAIAELNRIDRKAFALLGFAQLLDGNDIPRRQLGDLNTALMRLRGLDADELDKVILLPRPSERILEWRRRALAGEPMEPSTLTNL